MLGLRKCLIILSLGKWVQLEYQADTSHRPGFMKTTGSDTNGGYLCGVQGETCTYDWREAYAAFLLQYVKFYASAGVPITHLGFLNEPELA